MLRDEQIVGFVQGKICLIGRSRLIRQGGSEWKLMLNVDNNKLLGTW